MERAVVSIVISASHFSITSAMRADATEIATTSRHDFAALPILLDLFLSQYVVITISDDVMCFAMQIVCSHNKWRLLYFGV